MYYNILRGDMLYNQNAEKQCRTHLRTFLNKEKAQAKLPAGSEIMWVLLIKLDMVSQGWIFLVE